MSCAKREWGGIDTSEALTTQRIPLLHRLGEALRIVTVAVVPFVCVWGLRRFGNLPVEVAGYAWTFSTVWAITVLIAFIDPFFKDRASVVGEVGKLLLPNRET